MRSFRRRNNQKSVEAAQILPENWEEEVVRVLGDDLALFQVNGPVETDNSSVVAKVIAYQTGADPQAIPTDGWVVRPADGALTLYSPEAFNADFEEIL